MVVTTGATEAIAGAMLGLVDPGDEVVVLEPYYDSYVAMIQIAGGVRRPVTLRAPDFRLDLDELEAAITERTKLILLNTPAQPDRHGAHPRRARGRRRRWRSSTTWSWSPTRSTSTSSSTAREHVPIATLPGMAERTLSISSSGKTFSFTGWKIGWATGPAELVAAVEGAKNWLSFASGPAAAGDRARADHELGCPPRPRGRTCRPSATCCARAWPQARRQRPGPGGHLLRHHGRRRLGWPDGLAFCLALPERAGVVAIPSQGFYDDKEEGRHLVRWAFCKTEDVIREGLARLAGADLVAR